MPRDMLVRGPDDEFRVQSIGGGGNSGVGSLSSLVNADDGADSLIAASIAASRRQAAEDRRDAADARREARLDQKEARDRGPVYKAQFQGSVMKVLSQIPGFEFDVDTRNLTKEQKAFRIGAVNRTVDRMLLEGGYNKMSPQLREATRKTLGYTALRKGLIEGNILNMSDADTLEDIDFSAPINAAQIAPKTADPLGRKVTTPGNGQGKVKIQDYGIAKDPKDMSWYEYVDTLGGNLTPSNAELKFRESAQRALGSVASFVGDASDYAFASITGNAEEGAAQAQIARERNNVVSNFKLSKDQKLRALQDLTEREAINFTKQQARVKGLGGTYIGQFADWADEKLQQSADATAALRSKGSNKNLQEFGQAFTEGRYGDAISTFFEQPITHAAGMAGYVVGSGGAAGGARVLGAKLVGRGAQGVRAYAQGNVAGIAAGQATSANDEVRGALDAMTPETMENIPAFRAMRERQSSRYSDEDIRANFIETQARMAGATSAATSILGMMVGGRTELLPVDIARVLTSGIKNVALQAGAKGAVTAVKTLGREALGEGIEGAGEAFSVASGKAGGYEYVNAEEFRRIGARGAIEATLGAIAGGGIGVTEALVSKAITPKQAAGIYEDTQGLVAEEFAAARGNEPDTPLDDDLEVGGQDISFGRDFAGVLEQAQKISFEFERQVISDPEHAPNQSAALDEAKEKRKDVRDVGAVAGDNLSAADTQRITINDKAEMLTGQPSELVAPTQVLKVLAGAAAYRGQPFVNGVMVPDPAAIVEGVGQGKMLKLDPVSQREALVREINATGKMNDKLVEAAEALIEAGLGGPSKKVSNAMVVARKVAKANPELAGITDVMQEIVGGYNTLNAARNALANAVRPKDTVNEDGTVSETPVNPQAVATATTRARDLLRKEGVELVADPQQSVKAKLLVYDAPNTPPAHKRKLLNPYKNAKTSSLTDLNKAKAQTRRLARAPMAKAVHEQGFLSTSMIDQSARNIGAVTNDMDPFKKLEDVIIALGAKEESAGNEPSQRAAKLAARGALVEETASEQRITANEDISQFMSQHVYPVEIARDNAVEALAAQNGGDIVRARSDVEKYLFVQGVKGRVYTKAFSMVNRLKDDQRIGVWGVHGKLSVGAVSELDARVELQRVFDAEDSYLEGMLPKVLANDTVESTTPDPDNLADPDAPKVGVLDRIAIDVTLESDLTPNIVTIPAAEDFIANLEASLAPAALEQLKNFSDMAISSAAEMRQLERDAGLVEDRADVWTRVTGISDNYFKHGRVQQDRDTENDGDLLVNFGNVAQKSQGKSLKVPPLKGSVETLTAQAYNLAMRKARNAALIPLANAIDRAETLGATKFGTVRQARPSVFDPDIGSYSHPDQPTVDDLNVHTVRHGGISYIMEVTDPDLNRAVETIIVPRAPEDTTFAKIASIGAAGSRKASRLMLAANLPYAVMTIPRDTTLAVAQVFNSSGVDATVTQRVMNSAAAISNTAVNLPALIRFHFQTPQSRQKWVKDNTNNPDPDVQKIVYLHSKNAFAELRYQSGDLSSGGDIDGRTLASAARGARLRNELTSEKVKNGKSSKLTQAKELTSETVTALHELIDKVPGLKVTERYALNFINRVPMLADTIGRYSVFTAATQAGIADVEAGRLTKQALDEASAARTRAMHNSSVRPDTGKVKGLGPKAYLALQSITFFAAAQVQGITSNFRSMYRDNVDPAQFFTNQDGTVTRTTSVRDQLESLDKAKVIASITLGVMGYQAALYAYMAASGNDDLEKAREGYARLSMVNRMNNSPIASLLDMLTGASDSDVNADGSSDVSLLKMPGGFDTSAFFAKMGFISMAAMNEDKEDAFFAATRAFGDSFSPLNVTDVVGAAAQDNDTTAIKEFIKVMLPKAGVSQVAGYYMNSGYGGSQVRDSKFVSSDGTLLGTLSALVPPNDDKTDGRLVSTPGQYRGFGEGDTGEVARYVARQTGVGSTLDMFLDNAHKAAIHPEADGFLSGVTGRLSYMNDSGRYSVEFGKYMKEVYGPAAEALYSAKKADEKLGRGVRENVNTWKSNNPEAAEMHKLMGDYLNDKDSVTIQYFAAQDAGNSAEEGERSTELKRLKIEVVSKLLTDYPDAVKR